MKLREQDTTTALTSPGVIDTPDGESIRVRRLTPAGGAEAAPESTEPAPLRFVTEPPRTALLSRQATLRLVAAACSIVVLLVVLIASGSGGGGSHRASKPAVRLTPAQQRAVTAQRARAAAIAKAKRDRGTDAELQDTVPAATPPA